MQEAGRGRWVHVNYNGHDLAYLEKDGDSSSQSRAAEALSEIGVEAVYCDGPILTHKNGVTTEHNEAMTAPDGTVYVSSGASLSSVEIAYKLVETIAKSTKTEIQTNEKTPNNNRIKLFFENYTAIISESDSTNHWLLTGWENEKETITSANGEGYDSTEATTVMSTHTQHNGDVIVSNNSISNFDENVKQNQADTESNKNYSSHGVSYDFFKNMPDYIGNAPLFISNDKKVTVITEYAMKDTKGNDSYVIAGILRDTQIENDTVNLIKSVYPLDDFSKRIIEAAKGGKIVIINKNKVEKMLTTIGIQPAEVSSIINLAESNVSQVDTQSQDEISENTESNKNYIAADKFGKVIRDFTEGKITADEFYELCVVPFFSLYTLNKRLPVNNGQTETNSVAASGSL